MYLYIYIYVCRTRASVGIASMHRLADYAWVDGKSVYGFVWHARYDAAHDSFNKSLQVTHHRRRATPLYAYTPELNEPLAWGHSHAREYHAMLR
jgi:hypothetical protein